MAYSRPETKWITAADRRSIWASEHHARENLRKPLRWHLTFHPAFMAIYPGRPLADVFKDGRRRTATLLSRRGIGFYGIWSRENYEGSRREHLHLALYLPDEDAAADLEEKWRSWFPGDERMLRLTQPGTILDPRTGRYMSRAVSYVAKQMHPSAAFHPDPKRRYSRESTNRWGELIAPVRGQKWGVTDTLSPEACITWRPPRSWPFLPPAMRHAQADASPRAGLSTLP